MPCQEYNPAEDEEATVAGRLYSAETTPGISQEQADAINAMPAEALLQKATENLPVGLLQAVAAGEYLALPENAHPAEHAVRAKFLGCVVAALVGPNAVIVIKDSEQK